MAGAVLWVGGLAGIGVNGIPSPSPVYIYTATPEGGVAVPAATSSTTEPAAAPPATPTIREGTWTVGTDFPPGTYRTTADVGSSCYWQITKPGGNEVTDIIANDFPGGGRPQVTLEAGQKFKTNRCGTWVLV
jgi:hypothetical protein